MTPGLISCSHRFTTLHPDLLVLHPLPPTLHLHFHVVLPPRLLLRLPLRSIGLIFNLLLHLLLGVRRLPVLPTAPALPYHYRLE